ncbi:hypothetical protein JOY44_08705 [Phormidium sp. CLA17]|uniref:hypothetical protein n=1 Tax=Leptolyngbya sp. Cla-17 TaxID=2803751 RepID=UPI0014912EA1|nr:hypothetical protein [Leptolyngbya sp. Cla-17]MBM0741696.1 hypothetical protein [Leptolyngbya sp. Cla-17]
MASVVFGDFRVRLQVIRRNISKGLQSPVLAGFNVAAIAPEIGMAHIPTDRDWWLEKD